MTGWWAFRGWREKLRVEIHRVAIENATPPRLLAACVLGAMVGATPLFGLHLPLCLVLGRVLRLNRVALVAASNVSLPPLVPFLGAASIAVGGWILNSDAATSPTLFDATSPWKLGRTVFVAWLAGAPVVGGALGLAGGSVAVAVARRRGRRYSDSRCP